MNGPVIEGKLVRLRPPRIEDAEVMITWFEDLEVTRFLKLRHPPSLEAEKEWVDKVAKDPNHIQWVIGPDRGPARGLGESPPGFRIIPDLP
jgi:RimJ/RimL family protein N-acetyltransferase